MDLLIMKSDWSFSAKAKLYPIASPSFQITQNVIGEVTLDNDKRETPTNGYALRLADLGRQFFDYDDKPFEITTNRLFGFINVQNRQFLTTAGKPQNFRDQFLAVIPNYKTGSTDFSQDFTFSPGATHFEIQFQCDDRGRSRIRSVIRTQAGDDERFWKTLTREEGFDSSNIISCMGMRIPRGYVTNGVIAIRQGSYATNEQFEFIKLTRIEDESGSLRGVRVSNALELSGNMTNPTYYDSDRTDTPVQYYQENNYLNILSANIISTETSMAQLDSKMIELTNSMTELNKSMNDLRKDVDEITGNNSALFVSR